MSENTPVYAHEPVTSDAAAWLMLGGLALLTTGLSWQSSLAVAPDSYASLVIACGALGGVALFYRYVRPLANFSVMCTALAQVLLFSALGSLLSYQLAQMGGALWDDSFAAWDAALGFDWLSFVQWVDRIGWIVLPLRLAYASLIPQIIVLVLVLGFTMRLRELRQLILAAILCGTITVLLSPLFPAVSNYVHLGLTRADFTTINPYAGYIHLEHLNALRASEPMLLRFHEMQGIITFPSYHAGLAGVTLWGFWIARYGWLRWPGMALAAATIIATPVDGGHYLVDLIAGGAMAALSVWAAGWLVRWVPARQPGASATALPA
jgi:membrane-associated phospholipid phosphatase